MNPDGTAAAGAVCVLRGGPGAEPCEVRIADVQEWPQWVVRWYLGRMCWVERDGYRWAVELHCLEVIG